MAEVRALARGVAKPLWPGDARLVVQAWLGTRLVMVLVAVWAMATTGRSFADIAANWDVQHYLSIATDGYANATDTAFFPGWPLLLRAVSLTGLPILVGGVLLALVCSALAAVALYRMAGAGAAIAWLLAPTAVFTAVPYTEAVFCAAAFWAWERASAKHWGQAAALAAVAASVRVSGVFLIGALGILALAQAGRPAERLRRLPWLLAPVAVVGGYAGYLYSRTGSWTAWYSAQTAGWARELSWPWESLRRTIEATRPGYFPNIPGAEQVFKAELVAMAVGLLVVLYSLARKRWADAAWVGVQVFAFSIAHWFMSVSRAVLLWHPLWVALGRLAEPRGRSPGAGRVVGLGVAVLVAVVVQAGWAWLFFNGRWAS